MTMPTMAVTMTILLLMAVTMTIHFLMAVTIPIIMAMIEVFLLFLALCCLHWFDLPTPMAVSMTNISK